jgi:DNA-binding CsgD family transcriptional regulator
MDQGSFDAAVPELHGALKLAGACACPFERALSLEGLARVHLVDGRAGVDPLVYEARKIFAEHGAEPALRRIDAFIETAGTKVAVVPLPAGLTMRELDVLRLVAHGLTDAEVGAELYISPRTVGQHLRSTYGKLGVHTRAAATRFAIEHGIS